MTAHRLQRLMAPAQIALHLGTAQVEIAVFEPNLLGGRFAVGNLKRHGSRRAENLERAHRDLDLASGKLGVDGALGAADDLALNRDVELGARLTGGLVRGRIMTGIQYQLHDSVTVAQIDKDEAAVIAARLHPSPERDLAPNLGRANRAAVIGSRPRRQRRILLSFTHCDWKLPVRRRIPVPADTRNSHGASASAITTAAASPSGTSCTSRWVLC